MSTRSNIGIIENGKVKVIHCHWDGYLSYVGDVLLNNYQDEKKIKELIGLGNLSSLGTTTKHTPDDWNTFSDHDDRCVTYADRGEKDQEAETYENLDEWIKCIRQSYVEFIYWWNGYEWYYSSIEDNFTEQKVLRQEEIDAEN